MQSGQYEKAADGFRQRLAGHKDDLAAFVGLAQADPSVWPSFIPSLESRVRLEGDYNAEFKLGILYFYEWKLDPGTHSKEIVRARKLLSQAWQQSKQPIIGMHYAEVYETSSPNLEKMALTLNQIIANLVGPHAMAYYEQSRLSDWRGVTPPIQRVPVANLRPLRGVLTLAGKLSGARIGHGVMQGNHVEMVYDPVPAEQQKKSAYLLGWRDAVDQAIQKT